jgi:hypothetical protein
MKINGVKIMNEVIKDIERLKEVRDQIRVLLLEFEKKVTPNSINEMYYTKDIIQQMIEEKEIVVKTFEKHHADDRSQWMSDVIKILKIGEK